MSSSARRTYNAPITEQFATPIDDEQLRKQKEEEIAYIRDNAKRYIDNKGRRVNDVSSLPHNIYQAQLNEEEISLPRGNINFQNLTVPEPLAAEFTDFYRPASEEQLRKEREERERIRNDLEREGAVRIFSPVHAIKPLNKYINENMKPLLEQMQQKQHEVQQQQQQQQQKQQDAESAVATATAAAEDQESNKVLPLHGRVMSLSRGGTYHEPASALEAIEYPFGGLPESDPAAPSMERIDVQTLTIMRYFESRFRYHIGKAGLNVELMNVREQYEVLPEHVERVSTEAYEPFEKCCLKEYCCGAFRLRHPGGPFPFMRYLTPDQWEEWERTGRKPANISSMCYWCYLQFIGYITDQNIRESNRSAKVYPDFYNPIDRPGAYNRKAIRPSVEGYTNGHTRPIRFFAPEQLVPAKRRVKKLTTDKLTGQQRLEEVEVLCWRESDSVLFFNGERKDSHHMQVAPPSYTVTQFETQLPTAVNVLRGEFIDPDVSVRKLNDSTQVDFNVPLGPLLTEKESLARDVQSVQQKAATNPVIGALASSCMPLVQFEQNLRRQRERDEELLPSVDSLLLHPKGQRPPAKKQRPFESQLTVAPPKTTIGSLSAANSSNVSQKP